MQALKYAAALLVGIILGAVGYWLLHRCDCGDVVGSVTTITRDTIRPEVPRPVKVKKVARLKIKPAKARTFNGGVTTHAAIDSLNADAANESAGVTIDEAGEVEIPITQKEYKTADYTAWVSGFKPALDSITLYPQVKTTTVTKYKAPRWSITVGPGAFYDGQRVVPTYIGVTAGFVILSK